MDIRLLLFMLGRIAWFCALILLVPFVMCKLEPTGNPIVFGVPIVMSIAMGAIGSVVGRKPDGVIHIKDSLMFVVLCWSYLCLMTMMPYLVEGKLTLTETFFESVSALTTTGATCLVNTDEATESVLLWRSMTQWVGGLTIIALMTTVMPQIGGNFGRGSSMDDGVMAERMSHRIGEIVKDVSVIYIGTSVIAAVIYWLCGIRMFDALNCAMVTISTSGSYYSDSFRHFDNWQLEMAAVIFMMFSSGNFLLYWRAAQRRSMKTLLQDREIVIFVSGIIVVGLILSLNLYLSNTYSILESLRYGMFQTVSFASTTGFLSADFYEWPDFGRYILFLLIFVGGCVGSAAGGMKVSRIVILMKISWAELKRSLHPQMIITIKQGEVTVPMQVVGKITCFFFLYMMVYIFFTMLLSLSGMSMLDTLGITAACLNSAGVSVGIGGSANLFLTLPGWAKLVCCMAMIVGKLEIFSLLVLLHGDFWHRKKSW